MITDKTVFILGAGASKPYGYPTGRGLRNDICMNFLNRIEKLALDAGWTPHDFEIEVKPIAQDFVQAFYKSSTPSVDLFLASNPQFSGIGKRAIVVSILEAERGSGFREKVDVKLDWYFHLFTIMTRELTEPKTYKRFGENKISFITFNYDRSLEHFLYESLSNRFRAAPEEAIVNELKKIRISHVYGKIDELLWEKRPETHGVRCGTHYRVRPQYDVVIRMQENIKTIHEISGQNQNLKDMISQATKIFFLGFGFAKENLDVLGIPTVLKNDHLIFGTAVDWLEKEIRDIKIVLGKNYNKPVVRDARCLIRRDLDCRKLLREYL